MADSNAKSIRVAIFTGGAAPDAADTAQCWQEAKPDVVIAADSGLDTCAKYNEYFADSALQGAFTPSVVVGDFDSVSSGAAIPPGAAVERCDAAKDLSDTEIALRRAYSIGAHPDGSSAHNSAGETAHGVHITLVGGDGGRLDHLLAIYDTFSTPYHAHVWLLREQKAVYLADGSTITWRGLHKGDIVSAARLMGSRTGGTFITQGLVWGGEKFRAEGVPSLSNWAAGDGEVSITTRGCALLVMAAHWGRAEVVSPPNDDAAPADALSRRLAFTAEIDKMTHVLRRTLLLDGSRRENDAEHSWHIGMMALIFAPYMTVSVNKEHAAALCLAHDLVEIYAGDTFAFDKSGYQTKRAREEDAANRLFAMLPDGQAEEVRGLWDEFEEGKTAESQLANCMDRLQPFLHNTLTAGHTWVEGSVKLSDVLERMRTIKEYMPSVWPWVEGKIAEAMDRGWIEPDDGQAEEVSSVPAAVIFDMDGVLLDTESICDKTWIAAAPDFGLSTADAQRVLSECRGRNRADTLAALRRDFGSGFDAEGYLDRTIALFHEVEGRDGIAVMRGAKSALQYLKGKGYRVALASSTKGDTVRRQLETAGLLSFFETLTTGDKVTHSKPDPQIYLMAAASLSLPPDCCAAIEDSPNGVKSAAAAGMRCILVPDREKPTPEVNALAWRVLQSLEEIGRVL